MYLLINKDLAADKVLTADIESGILCANIIFPNPPPGEKPFTIPLYIEVGTYLQYWNTSSFC